MYYFEAHASFEENEVERFDNEPDSDNAEMETMGYIEIAMEQGNVQESLERNGGPQDDRSHATMSDVYQTEWAKEGRYWGTLIDLGAHRTMPG